MKIAGIVILYNPNVEDVLKNISAYIHDIDILLVWKNSKIEINYPKTFVDKIVELGDGTNRFIAEPLNMALNYCKENKIDYLLTMDQDTCWRDFKGFKNYVLANADNNVVAYSPNINGEIKSLEDLIEVKSIITSGALHNVELTLGLGGFREDYQIYWVDGEFCYWSRINGYKIMVLPKYSIDHQFGSSTKEVLGVRGADYSPIVYYYMFRNMLWMRREYQEKGVGIKTILYTMKLYIPGIILCEDRKFEKLIKIIKAFKDGLFSSGLRKRQPLL